MLQYGVGNVQGEFYGAKACLNLWKPNVVGEDFSLSQIWVVVDGPNTQTLEAGWQVTSVHRSSFRENNENDVCC